MIPTRILAILVAALLPGCASGPIARLTGAATMRTPHPFDPVALRVHPLTHIDPAGPAAGPDQCLLILHIELKDAFADSVKGLGPLTVELFRPGAGPTPGIETQALVWDVPEFANPAANASRFDTATHTYRIPLIAPRWVDEVLGPGAARGEASWLKVRVTLATRDADSRTLLLADEFVIQR